MAVDTAQKRAALISFISPIPYPIPIAGDGTIDGIDRASLAGIYRDTGWAAPSVSLGGADFNNIWIFLDG